jgi:hypothetical protein
MLDFTELPVDGNLFEQLIREILLSKGFRVFWSGKGPDGGKDLLAFENYTSIFGFIEKKWLIQCKHKAHSGSAVGIDDLDNIVDSCKQHDVNGYLLVCSTYPSSAVVERLEQIKYNKSVSLDTSYWDSVILEKYLTTQYTWNIAHRFLPVSSKSEDIKITATDDPSYWIMNYKDYYFHLSNRVGSYYEMHFESIKARIKELESIKIFENQFLRLRAVHFDDKNGNYTYYIDYLYQSTDDEKNIIPINSMKSYMGDEYSLEDGQVYHFDIIGYSISVYSDHFDKDHAEYYLPYIQNFRSGTERDKYLHRCTFDNVFKKLYYSNNDDSIEKPFIRLIQLLSKMPFLKILNQSNAKFELLDKFYYKYEWSEIIEHFEIFNDSFFSCTIRIECGDFEKLIELLNLIPISMKKSISLKKIYIYFFLKVDTKKMKILYMKYIFRYFH